MIVRVEVRVRARGPGVRGPVGPGGGLGGQGGCGPDARGPEAWGRAGWAGLRGPRERAQGNGLELHIFLGFYPREGRYRVVRRSK